MKRLVAMAAVILLASCSSANVDDVKAHAAETWKQAGFEIIGYEGYAFGLNPWPGHGGGQVWYTLRRIPDNGVIYHGFLVKWGSEYHIYNVKAIDALTPDQ